MIDRALLLEALARVEAEASKPEEESLWNQRSWCEHKECGTAYCFAGWILKVYAEHYPTRIDMNAGTSDRVELEGGLYRHIQIAAIQVARLPPDEASLLFSPYNTLDALRRLVRTMIEQEEREQETK